MHLLRAGSLPKQPFLIQEKLLSLLACISDVAAFGTSKATIIYCRKLRGNRDGRSGSSTALQE